MAICWIEQVVNEHPTGLLKFRCHDRNRHPRSKDTGQEVGLDDIVVVQPGQTLNFENFAVPWPIVEGQALYVSSVIGNKRGEVRLTVHQGTGERDAWDWVHVHDANGKELGLIDAGSLGDVPGTNHSVWHLRLEVDGSINLYQVWKQGLTQKEAKVLVAVSFGVGMIVVGGVVFALGAALPDGPSVGRKLIGAGVELLIETGKKSAPAASTPIPAARTSSILGVGTNHQLYRRAALSSSFLPMPGLPMLTPAAASPWEHVPGSGDVMAITTLSNGIIVGVGMNHQLYWRATLSSPWEHVPDSGDVTALAALPDNSIVGVGMDHQLYRRARLSSPWEHVPGSGDVMDVTALPSGVIVGVGMNHQLYRRAALSSPWEYVPDSGDVTAVAALPNGVIVGVGLDHQLYRRSTLLSPWANVPNSGDVTAVAILHC